MESQYEADMENYAPSTVAAAMAFGALLTSKTETSDDQG
jgi:hypothetical protein